MSLFQRSLFVFAHSLVQPNFYPIYKKLIKNQWRTHLELKNEQNKNLRYMIRFCYDNVPYYHTLLKKNGLGAESINTVEDLQKLPILTKDIIKENWDAFKPVNLNRIRYNERTTGGSTGTPFKYRISTNDRFLSSAILYRGWGHGGYQLGDRMVILAGSSLDVQRKKNFMNTIQDISRNIKKISSYDMGYKEMFQYTKIINDFHPHFIRGYASSTFFYAKWLVENAIEVHSPTAVFTTAEKLLPHMRDTISHAFNCDVFDGYGLNDGGISAYECSEHSGFHVDTERGVLEVVDDLGQQVKEGQGRIVATSLFNFSMPFIRYDTKDFGSITEDICPCGRNNPLLTEIIGREYEMLLTPDGVGVFGGFFTTQIFDNLSGIAEFQVVQEEIDRIVISIVPQNSFSEIQLDYIRTRIKKKCNDWNVTFNIVKTIEKTGAGKHKFIVNKVLNRN